MAPSCAYRLHTTLSRTVLPSVSGGDVGLMVAATSTGASPFVGGNKLPRTSLPSTAPLHHGSMEGGKWGSDRCPLGFVHGYASIEPRRGRKRSFTEFTRRGVIPRAFRAEQILQLCR